MERIHNLLRRQIRRHFNDSFSIAEDWQGFFDAVNSAYWESDADRGMLERALELSSQELLQTNSEMRAFIQALPDEFLWLDHEGTVTGYKAGSTTNLHPSMENLVGRQIQDIALVDVGNKFNEAINRVREKGSITSIEYSLVIKGYERFYEARLLPLLDNQIFAVIRDITERKRMEDQLKYLSLHDSLTGLYNRTYFEGELHRLSDGRNDPVGLIICDIDNLKLINDTLGHDAGDSLLVAAAGVFKNTFREYDMVARIGGDEFAILLSNTNNKELDIILNRLEETIESYNSSDPSIPLSISVGFAVRNDASMNINDLFKEADNNMYREKFHRSQYGSNAIIQTLIKTLEAKDFITEGHAERIQGLMIKIAKSIKLPDAKIADLCLLAQFHDIGKVGIPDRTLFKPGPLTSEEYAGMKRHCEIGRRIAISSPELSPIADWIFKHHEWWNGKGYPSGLKGEDIPIECRVLAIADAYDVMTNDRPYRRALSHQEALAELEKKAGIQFDPALVQKFIELFFKMNRRKSLASRININYK